MPTISGAWTASTSGGSHLQNQTWRSNPTYLLRVTAADSFTFSLTPTSSAPSAVGLLVLRLNEGEPLPAFPSESQKVAGSTFRSSELSGWRFDVRASDVGRALVVIAMTAEAGYEGEFTLTAAADSGADAALEPYEPPPAAAGGSAAGSFALAAAVDADGDGMPDEEKTEMFPPALPAGVEAFAGWAADAKYQSLRATAQQQGGEGWNDPDFEVQAVNPTTKKKESNAKILYVSGQAPSGASSSSKVDSWTRLGQMAAPASEVGGQMHLRPTALDDSRG